MPDETIVLLINTVVDQAQAIATIKNDLGTLSSRLSEVRKGVDELHREVATSDSLHSGHFAECVKLHETVTEMDGRLKTVLLLFQQNKSSRQVSNGNDGEKKYSWLRLLTENKFFTILIIIMVIGVFTLLGVNWGAVIGAFKFLFAGS
jgi:uncharacterized coiled-coil DUF342 family protein